MPTKKNDETAAKVQRCLRMLASPRSVSWSQGFRGLERLGTKAIRPLTAVPRRDEDPARRRTAATAMLMLRLKARSAAQALIDALTDEDAGGRIAAANALSYVGPP